MQTEPLIYLREIIAVDIKSSLRTYALIDFSDQSLVFDFASGYKVVTTSADFLRMLPRVSGITPLTRRNRIRTRLSDSRSEGSTYSSVCSWQAEHSFDVHHNDATSPAGDRRRHHVVCLRRLDVHEQRTSWNSSFVGFCIEVWCAPKTPADITHLVIWFFAFSRRCYQLGTGFEELLSRVFSLVPYEIRHPNLETHRITGAISTRF